MAGLVQQVDAHPASQGNLDMTEACVWANASGGFACFTIGGTYYEQRPGEKRERLLPYVQAYREQLAHGEA
jgi:hypothetical protein